MLWLVAGVEPAFLLLIVGFYCISEIVTVRLKHSFFSQLYKIPVTSIMMIFFIINGKGKNSGKRFFLWVYQKCIFGMKAS